MSRFSEFGEPDGCLFIFAVFFYHYIIRPVFAVIKGLVWFILISLFTLFFYGGDFFGLLRVSLGPVFTEPPPVELTAEDVR